MQARAATMRRLCLLWEARSLGDSGVKIADGLDAPLLKRRVSLEDKIMSFV